MRNDRCSLQTKARASASFATLSPRWHKPSVAFRFWSAPAEQSDGGALADDFGRWIKRVTSMNPKRRRAALATAPQSLSDARHTYFALEVLSSCNLAVAAAVLPICSDLLRICTRSD